MNEQDWGEFSFFFVFVIRIAAQMEGKIYIRAMGTIFSLEIFDKFLSEISDTFLI